MEIVAALIAVVAYLQGLDGTSQARKMHQQGNRRLIGKGINLILEGCELVETYYDDLDKGLQHSQEREREIAKVWKTAAECFQEIDNKIARVLDWKGVYWQSGGMFYSRKNIVDGKATIADVKLVAMRLKNKLDKK